MSASDTTYRALVFGASGITGWGIAKQALNYPTPTTFDKVIGLTNRPLSKEQALLPKDDRLVLYSGIDLSAGVDAVQASLGKVDGIAGVTHVYFGAYTGHGTGFEGIKTANVRILENAVSAVEKLCPNLKFWTFQTGGKWYGMEFFDRIPIPDTPFKESDPRISEPYAANIMYYAQFDLLERLSKGKLWSFSEVRPDGVTGFVPSNNAMNLAQALGLFFSFYASHEGPGTPVPYPGPPAAYTALHTDVSQDILARFHIYASLHPDLASSQGFNIGDKSEGVIWENLWPRLAAYFGLAGIPPSRDSSKEIFNINKYMHAHETEVAFWVANNGLKEDAVKGTDFGFLTPMLGMTVFDRQYDLTKAREIGFAETRDTVLGYTTAFDLLKAKKIIP